MESSAEEVDNSWITNFCNRKGNEFFCQVDRNYVEDGFNLYGLKSMVENFGECLDIILDRIEPDESDAASAEEIKATTELYGLIHARYIVTNHGLEAMHTKYLRRDFGTCPRYYCDNYPVLPLGMNDALGVARVNTYCPRCRQIFRPGISFSAADRGERSSLTLVATPSERTIPCVPDHVDGAFFGTTFAHLFLLTFGFPRVALEDELYVPRIFGFRLHHSVYQKAPVQIGALAAVDPSRYGRNKRPRSNDEFNNDDGQHNKKSASAEKQQPQNIPSQQISSSKSHLSVPPTFPQEK